MTKFSIVSPDASGQVDGAVYRFLQQFPNLVPFNESDVALVPITKLNNFKFNKELYTILDGMKWVLIDYVEYGWDWDRKETHFWGWNTEDFFREQYNEEWKAFDEFVKTNRPIKVFKRELLQADVSKLYAPIEYPCLFIDEGPADSREQFNARPVEVFNAWGHSHEARVNLHGNMFLQAGKFGYYLIDSFRNFEMCMDFENNPKKWASIYCPYFSRIDIRELLRFQSMSKVSVSLEGAGLKCFRHSESPINSVMVMRDDPLAWSYPWVHGENCLRIPSGSSMDSIKGTYVGEEEMIHINSGVNREDLYDIYLKGLENLNNYRVDNYFKNYVIPLIEAAL